MNRAVLVDELDRSIDGLLCAGAAAPQQVDRDLSGLMEVARDLACLPRPAFRAQLKVDLQRGFRPSMPDARHDGALSLPTLFRDQQSTYPVYASSFAMSLAMHAIAALLLIVASGIVMSNENSGVKHNVAALVTDANDNLLPAAPSTTGGGGGGGTHDKLPASKGTAPRFAAEQLTSPAVVIANRAPVLAVEQTVVGPPQITGPQSTAIGDSLARMLTASNGTGTGGGIGNGVGTGIGSGSGAGVGPGIGGGFGGGVFRVGGGVTAPRPIYTPDPDYADEARSAKIQGTVILWVVIGPDGRPRNMRIARSVGMGLDEKALQAVRNWRFEPARKDGLPVAVEVNIEVSFRLH